MFKYKIVYGYNNVIFSNSKNIKEHFKNLGGEKICIYDNKTNKLLIEAFKLLNRIIVYKY